MTNPGFPIEVVQNTDFSWQVTYQDVNGDPIDISGYTVEMQIRRTVNSGSTPLIDVSTTNGYITLDGVNGIINIAIPHALTATLTAPLDAVYDIIITSGSNIITRLLNGQVTVVERVTR